MKWIIRIAAGSFGLLSLLLWFVYMGATEEDFVGLELSNAEEASAFARFYASMCFLSVIIFFCTGEAEDRPAVDVHGTGPEGADESPPAPATAPDNATAAQPADQSDDGDDT